MKLRELGICVVDADNVFSVMGLKYKISRRVKEYRVYNSYANSEDFTNTSEMCTVKVMVDENNKFHFFDENDKEISKVSPLELGVD